MPQLNPAPWLQIFILVWVCFLTILPTKVVSHLHTQLPESQEGTTLENHPWLWVWH